MPEKPNNTESVPDALAVAILWRVTFEELLGAMPRKRSERMLRGIAQRLAEEESLSNVFSLRRSSSDRAMTQRAREQAARVYQQCLPIFVARLPEE